MPRTLFAIPAALLLAGAARAGAGADFYEAKVRPLLANRCAGCHSAAGKQRGGLALDAPAGLRRGGDSGPLFGPAGGPHLILQAVAHGPDAPAMPPESKLPAKELDVLAEWARLGFPLPAGAAEKPVPTNTSAADHWAFRPLREHPAPAPGNRIDAFIHAKLRAANLSPTAPADTRTLVRRLYFDITGLPPTVEDVERFRQSAIHNPKSAIEELVGQLLRSPAFGEKWGRHWLDVARYAEDNPTGESTCKPPRFPFRYRDWVIAALNADLPYREFVRRQVAADLIPGLDPGELAALGFLGLGPVYHKEPKLSKDVIASIIADEWDERIDAVTRGVLGLTVACARCHDHKFDPVSAEDYAALAGVMAGTQVAELPLEPGRAADAEELTTVRLKLVDTELRLGYAREMRDTAAKAKGDAAPFAARMESLKKELAALKEREKKLYAGPVATGVRDAGARVNGDDPAWTTVDYAPGRSVELPVFVRGNPSRPGPAPVPRRFLAALSGGNPAPFGAGSGRRELADALVGDAGPLAARVFVNRVWGWLFGRGLVGTPSNFGKLGEAPTHPELLDDLSARFAANGWSLKWLVREIVLSETYARSARLRNAECGLRIGEPAFAVGGAVLAFNPQSAIRIPQWSDPDNRLLARAPVRRLEAEQWRDAMLAVAGRLDRAAGGPSDDLDSPRAARRTIYGRVSRQRLSDAHRLFDLPDPKTHGERREPTTTPLQQLYFLNSPFVRRCAESLAARAAGPTTADTARNLFRLALQRDPAPAEAAEWAALAADAPAAAHALLISNEFLFLE